jgi:hypothetical protein
MAKRKPGDKFTGKCRQDFLDELERTGHIYHACKVAGISYQTMKHHRVGGPKADRDPAFESDYQQAFGNYVAMLKAEAQRRAVDGWEERPILDKDGNVKGHVQKYSDALLLALLKRSDEGYKERVQVDATTEHKGEVTHTHTHTAELEEMYKHMEPQEREAWKVALAALARVSAKPDEEATPPKEQLH